MLAVVVALGCLVVPAAIAPNAVVAQTPGAPIITSVRAYGEVITDPVPMTPSTVEWTIDPLGPQPTHYRIELTSDGSNETAEIVAPASVHYFFYTAADTDFEVRVSACLGEGDQELCGTAITSFTTPSTLIPSVEVSEVHATATSPNSIVITFTLGPGTVVGDGGAWLAGAEIRVAGAATGAQVHAGPGSEPLGWWGAAPDTTYTVTALLCWMPRITSMYCGQGSTTVTTPADVGSVAGTVVGPGGSPVAGSIVALYAPTDGWYPTASTTVAADGTFEVIGVPAGSYAVAVRSPTSSGMGVSWYGATRRRDAATPISVSYASPVTDLAIAVESGGTIGGRVTAGGLPVPGALVMAFAPVDRWVGTAVTYTAADGTYLVEGLADGSYRVLVVAPQLPARWYGDTATRAHAAVLEVVSSSSWAGIDVMVDQPAG